MHAGLRRRVLHLQHLALSPAARRSVRCGAASAGALKLLAAFPRTGGPLLVLSVDGRHIRAQETTLWMTRTALRGVPAMPPRLRPAAAAARACRERPRRPRRAAARQAGSADDACRASTGPRAPATASTGACWPRSIASRRTSAEHARFERRRGRLDAVPALHLAALGRRCSGDGIADPYDPQDAIFSAARYLDAAGGESDIRRAVFAYNHANWYVNEVLSIAAALPETSAPGGLDPRDASAVARRRARRPQRVGVRVGGQHAPPALLAGPAGDALGPAEALARGLLEPRVAELGGRRPAGPRPRPDPRSAGSTARSERSSCTSSARHGGHGRSAGRSTAGRCRARTPDSRRPRAQARPGRRTCRPPALRDRPRRAPRAHRVQGLVRGLAAGQDATTWSPGRDEERFCSGVRARRAHDALGLGLAQRLGRHRLRPGFTASSHHSHSSRAWLKAAVTRVAAFARSALRSGCVRATRSFQARRISSGLSGASSPSSHCARAICG